MVEVLVGAGDRVRAGQALVSLEAMKMEHTIQAPAAGTVAEVRVGPDTQVELGQVLLVVEPMGEGDDDG